MIELIEVQPDHVGDLRVLYALLSEREAFQSISHKKMPTWEEHCAFVQSCPYQVWYLIVEPEHGYVGSIYLTVFQEIGIFIFKDQQGKGFARDAVKLLMKKHPGPYLANINPDNIASRQFFEKLGFKFIQVTYCHE